MSFTQVTVTGTRKREDGTPAQGELDFLLTAPISDGTTTIEATVATVQLDSSGDFSITLDANDDSTTTPTGTAYEVTERVDGAIETYGVVVPHADAPTVTLDSLARVAI